MKGQSSGDGVELVLNGGWERRRHHEGSDGLSCAPQPFRLVRIESSRQTLEPIGQPVVGDEFIKSCPRQHCSLGNRRPEGDQSGPVLRLAADLGLVGGISKRDPERPAARAFPPS